MTLPRTGIEIWDGRPGSGKSFAGVRALIDFCVKDRRPVYTNMPVRIRSLRAYLKVKAGRAQAANYVRLLSKEHMDRFLARNEKRANAVERALELGMSKAHAEAEFDRESPAVLSGTGANWIPPGAVIIIDECHLWYDQRKQKAEPTAVLRYTTMHRHHLHLCILLTQDWMQVSLSWRRQCVAVRHYADKRRLPFLLGLSLPFLAFSCETYSPELLEGRSLAEATPVSTTAILPRLEGLLVLFRLYDSFTHVGGVGRLRDALEKTRLEVEGVVTPQTAKRGLSLLAALGAGVVFGAVAGGGAVAWWAGPPAQAAPVAATLMRDAPKVSTISSRGVRIDGRLHEPGAQVDGWTLVGSDGRWFWNRGADSVPCTLGARSPSRASAR